MNRLCLFLVMLFSFILPLSCKKQPEQNKADLQKPQHVVEKAKNTKAREAPKEIDYKKIAWDSLSENNREEITISTWKEATKREITFKDKLEFKQFMDSYVPFDLWDKKRDKKKWQAYWEAARNNPESLKYEEVEFPSKRQAALGNIAVVIDKKTNIIIARGVRE